MRPPPNRQKQVWAAVGAAALLGFAWFAWLMLGGLGIALLGLLMLFVAVRVELEGDRPVGTQSKPEMYAAHFQAEQEQSRAERAGRRAEVAGLATTARSVAIAGVLLAFLGFGLVFLVQGAGGDSNSVSLLGALSALTFLKGKPW